ncbi:hypothetical protein Efla_004906 [Eimeria flavescens]
MAREIKDIREFLQTARRKDARKVVILRSMRRPKNQPFAASSAGVLVTKFKIRCAKHLYTLVVADKTKAQKIEGSLPPSLKQQVIPAKKKGNPRMAKQKKARAAAAEFVALLLSQQANEGDAF